MPRAYYRPFTAYEEAVGFKGAKRNAHIFCGIFFAGLLFKIILAYHFSPASNRQILAGSGVENNPAYIASMEQRASLAESWMTQDSMKNAVERRRQRSAVTDASSPNIRASSSLEEHAKTFPVSEEGGKTMTPMRYRPLPPA